MSDNAPSSSVNRNALTRKLDTNGISCNKVQQLLQEIVQIKSARGICIVILIENNFKYYFL